MSCQQNYNKLLQQNKTLSEQINETKNNNNKISTTNSSSGCGYESDNLNSNDSKEYAKVYNFSLGDNNTSTLEDNEDVSFLDILNFVISSL